MDQEVVEAKPFQFTMTATDAGITELRFQKNAPMLLGVLVALLSYVNSTFDEPLPTTGGFLRMLADMTDDMEKLKDERSNQEDGEPTPA